MRLPSLQFPTRLMLTPAWRERLARIVPPVLLMALVTYSVILGSTTELIGPHWDDEFKYANRALTGIFDPGVRSRYAHIWGMRVFYDLIDDRRVAAGLYSSIMSSGLMIVAYAFGKRATGGLGGLVAALCVYGFAPVSTFWSEPQCDPPATFFAGLALLCATRHRDGGRIWLWSLLCGLSMFVSIKCKETGIAAAPVALLLMSERREHLRNTFVFGLVGVLLGQGILCIADGVYSGDPWQSLRFEVYRSYVRALGSKPRPRDVTREVLIRTDWVSQLLSKGVREITFAGTIGLILGFRRQLAIRVLALWTIFNLIFGAWVCWRYTGIDVVTRYLVPLAPALCVGTAYLLVFLARRNIESPIAPWPIVLALVGLACTVAVVGLHLEWSIITEAIEKTPSCLPGRRLFELTAPLCLCVAALTHFRRLRLPVLALGFAAILLSGTLDTQVHIERRQLQLRTWMRLADNIVDQKQYRLAIYHANPRSKSPLNVGKATNTLISLSHLPMYKLDVRVVKALGEIQSDEIVVVDYGNYKDMRRLHRIHPKRPWKLMHDVRWGSFRARIYWIPNETADSATL